MDFTPTQNCDVINIKLQDSKKETEKPQYMTTIANLLWL